MFFFGVIAIIQNTFLPGILLLKILPTRWRVIPTVVFAFGLSLLANYVLVFALTSVHLYTHLVMLIIFFIELSVAVYLYWDAFTRPINQVSEKIIYTLHELLIAFIPKKEEFPQKNSFGRVLVLILTIGLLGYALSIIIWGFNTWLDGLGEVIDRWDAVVSWNKWAVQWAGNNFPQKTWEYPQLIPINLSISYVMMGNTGVQFFNTAHLGLFLFYVLLLLFDLALQHRSLGFYAGIIAAKFIFKEFTWQYFHTAYVDIPLALFAFASVFAILQAKKVTQPEQVNGYIWIGILLAAGAAVTKQGGMYMLLVVPLMVRYLVLNEAKSAQGEAAFRKKLFRWVGTVLLIVLPWYLYIQIGISQGVLESNIDWVSNGIFGDLSYWQRFLNAFILLGFYGYFLLLLLIGGFWLGKPFRWMIYGIILPYFLIWAVFFGYDPRNLSLIFGFWGLGLGLLLEVMLGWGTKIAARLKLGQIPVLVLPGLVFMGAAVGGLVVTDKQLTQKQNELQRHILDDALNTFLYDYFSERGKVEPILTDYPLEYLPGLEGVSVSFRQAEFFYQRWQEYPEIDLILMPNDADKDLKAEIFEGIEIGKYELIFHETNFNYFFIRRLVP